jgi:hypothetical protein
MRTYYRIVDGGANDPPAGYTWTFATPVQALGGIVTLFQVDKFNPISSTTQAQTSATNLTVSEIAAVPELGYLIFCAFVDKNEDLNATGGTLAMTEQFEPRANKNVALWTQPFPSGGHSGTRSFSISTGINQDIGGLLIALNPAT